MPAVGQGLAPAAGCHTCVLGGGPPQCACQFGDGWLPQRAALLAAQPGQGGGGEHRPPPSSRRWGRCDEFGRSHGSWQGTVRQGPGEGGGLAVPGSGCPPPSSPSAAAELPQQPLRGLNPARPAVGRSRCAIGGDTDTTNPPHRGHCRCPGLCQIDFSFSRGKLRLRQGGEKGVSPGQMWG